MKTLSTLIAAGIISMSSLTAEAVQLPFTVTIRDFRCDAAATNHDFNNTTISGVTTGMVANTLDAQGKPVFIGSAGMGDVLSAATFAAWYRDCDGSALSCNSSHTVNFLADVDLATGKLTYSNSAFFPIDALTSSSVWDSPNHNFFFTSELRQQLIYDPTKENKFSFTGDDDVWVFINGKLVLDLGGIHAAATKSFDLDDLVGSLGIAAYDIYDFTMFHAERHYTQSNLGIESTLGQPLNVPEPATLAMLGLGLLGMASIRRRKQS